MSKLTIYGASDDLVEVTGEFDEEFRLPLSGWRGRVVSPDGDSLIVTAEYDRPESDAEWTLGVENSGTWPSWPIHFTERPDREGDPAIVIDVPEGTIVEEVS